uniref:Uncharacterized protein n=1 Tax=Anguilla anguilla TaxID=7936 RepID=A0A0E9PQT9_ANGAN
MSRTQAFMVVLQLCPQKGHVRTMACCTI